MVLAKANEQCLDAIDSVLKQFTERFKLAEVEPTPDGNSALEYLIALPKDTTPSQFISTLRARAQEHVIAAEYRNLKRRKSKEDRAPHWTLPK